MPKRSTLTFSSEDAPPSDDDLLHVYYCKYSGQHCFITGAWRPPRRQQLSRTHRSYSRVELPAWSAVVSDLGFSIRARVDMPRLLSVRACPVYY